MEGLQGKTAIVTGGSSGIGQAIAIRLGHEGVNVAVNYVGPMEGAVATRDEIDAGVRRCLAEIEGARRRAGRCWSRPTCPTSRRWPGCSRTCAPSSGASTS